MQLYNSLTKKKSVFRPINVGRVGVYSCGPTVYDHVHIGNLRSFIVADLLVRILKSVSDYEVEWVMNTTDIDDKIIARLERDQMGQDPEKSRMQLTKKYEKLFFDDIAAVGVNTTAIKLVRATEHITQMQALIKELLKKDLAYQSAGSIYFSIEKYQAAGQKYGVLTNIDFAGQIHSSDDQDQKEGIVDFALWKAAKEGEPSWDFELDDNNLVGRPGWHIECSAMSTNYLGAEFDIHTGGIDLRFPHHENEIAQCGGKLAHYFIHNEMLTIESTKMSKSLNNFFKLDQIGDGLAFRYLVLGAHYRTKIDYSAEALMAARTRLNHINEFCSKIINNKLTSKSGAILARSTWGGIRKSLADDLNSPRALAELANLTKSTELDSQSMHEVMVKTNQALGLGIDFESLKITDQNVQALLHERQEVRHKNDYIKSDQLRDQLKSLQVGVEDTTSGQICYKLASYSAGSGSAIK